eukprot:TRINITY_DN24371_c0_g2_i1.p1 TRINITY_DN24371_c0_g2~~TRINITY_DN24371_c0_g2_i1.p1  ORF type:complete len:322 (-),score=40.14 TRINITY_DN24371_c0_g2_i1:361-1233(-)
MNGGALGAPSFAEDLSILMRGEGADLSMMDPAPSLVDRVPETRLPKRAPSLAPSVERPKDGWVDAGMPSMNARSECKEDNVASVRGHHDASSGNRKANKIDYDRLAFCIPCRSVAPRNLDEQQCSSTSLTAARDEQIGNAPAREFFKAKSGETHDAEKRTTVLMRNIPRGYTSTKLMRTIDEEGFSGLYDFLYVPMVMNRRCALGYAVVNLVDPYYAKRFMTVFEGHSRWCTMSRNVCHIVWAEQLQGLQAHIAHFRNATVMGHRIPHECKPRLFENGTEIDFPPPCKGA